MSDVDQRASSYVQTLAHLVIILLLILALGSETNYRNNGDPFVLYLMWGLLLVACTIFCFIGGIIKLYYLSGMELGPYVAGFIFAVVRLCLFKFVDYDTGYYVIPLFILGYLLIHTMPKEENKTRGKEENKTPATTVIPSPLEIGESAPISGPKPTTHYLYFPSISKSGKHKADKVRRRELAGQEGKFIFSTNQQISADIMLNLKCNVTVVVDYDHTKDLVQVMITEYKIAHDNKAQGITFSGTGMRLNDPYKMTDGDIVSIPYIFQENNLEEILSYDIFMLNH